jgi:hypothetical protein
MARKKLKKQFVGSCIYIPKKTILSDNMPNDIYNVALKLDPNLFETEKNVTTKKNTKLSE